MQLRTLVNSGLIPKYEVFGEAAMFMVRPGIRASNAPV